MSREIWCCCMIEVGRNAKKADWRTCHGVVVSGDGAHDDQAGGSLARLLAFLQVLQQQVGQQEVAQVVGAHADLKAVRREAGLLGSGQVHRSVAHEAVHGEPGPPVEDLGL